MTVDAIITGCCGVTMYARAQHDFRYCPCGGTFIDGDYRGPGVGRIGGDMGFKGTTVSVDATVADLYEDWNHGGSRYGIAPSTQSPA